MAAHKEDPDVNIAWHIWVGTIIPLVAATFAVLGRFFARKMTKAEVGWHFWNLIAAHVTTSLKLNSW